MIPCHIVRDKLEQLCGRIECEQRTMVRIDLGGREYRSDVVQNIFRIDARKRRIGASRLSGIIKKHEIDLTELILLAHDQGRFLDDQDIPHAEWLSSQIIDNQQPAGWIGSETSHFVDRLIDPSPQAEEVPGWPVRKGLDKLRCKDETLS